MKSEYILTLLLALLIGYLMYLVMLPFLIPVFWAAAFVIIFYPYYRWLVKKLGGRETLASALACVTIALFLIIPLALIGAMMATELLHLYQWAETSLTGISAKAHNSPVFIFPAVEKYLGRYIDVSSLDLTGIFANSVKEIATFMAEGLKSFVKSFVEFVFNLVLAFFTMYFLFKDGDRLLDLTKDLLPLSQDEKDLVIERNRAVISAAINGGIMVGAAQGVLGGIAFWFLGLSAPILWGFVMFLLSFLPGIGTAMVWGPAVIYLLIIGSYTKAVVLLVWGAAVIGLIDNLLRPIIMSGGTNIHPLLLFFSILGAVNVFGLIGIIAGPLIVSIAMAAVEMYRETTKKKHTWAG
ncbi:MAG: AI-2E family transporter [Deltaproteobacteria bacterium]|nr:AI-2E family transporter [Deltaproteobacteria bacterium]